MALYFYFNEATGGLVYSDQASYAEEGYTALGEQTDMNPQGTSDWIYDSNRSSIETVSKDPASGRIVGLTSMYGMFFGCSSLASLDLSGLDTSKVTDMRQTFRDCTSLASLDLSGFDTSRVTAMGGMFQSPLLARIHIGPGYTIGMPEPGSSVAGRDGRWHAIGGASYPPSSVPRVDAVYYAAADLVPDGSLLVNLEDLKAALANRGGLPLTKDTVIAEVGGEPVWVYAANAIEDGVPGFISRIAQGESWIEATFGCNGLRIEESMHSDAGQKNMSISMEMNFDGPVIKFGDEGLRGVLAYRNGMPVLTAMGGSAPIMAGDHPYGFATYATDTDFMDYVFALE